MLERRHVFAHLTVQKDLLAGSFDCRPARKQIVADLHRLKTRRKARAGLRSGGEQPMIVIGRGLMTRPVPLIREDPSMALAPMIVEEIFGAVRHLNAEPRVSFLIAEQNAPRGAELGRRRLCARERQDHGSRHGRRAEHHC